MDAYTIGCPRTVVFNDQTFSDQDVDFSDNWEDCVQSIEEK